MQGLASYILRGRVPAILAVAALAVLSLALPPLSWPLAWFSAGGVTLVTLARSVADGALVVAGATILVAVTGGLFGQMALAFGLLLSLWLPVWVAAAALRSSRSLVLGLAVCALLGLLAIFGVWVVLDDPVAWWVDFVQQELLPALEQAGIALQAPDQFEQSLVAAARLMTGALVASSVLGLSISLLIGRWWHAQQERPGAFGEEFRRLRLGKIVSLLAVVTGLLAAFLPGSGGVLMANLLLVMGVPFLLQGLAVVHALLGRRSTGRAGLVLFYVMLVLFIPWSLVFVAVLGLLDNGLNIRARLPADAA